jgi:glycosyltransferase involved in cell wall biosynthesis
MRTLKKSRKRIEKIYIFLNIKICIYDILSSWHNYGEIILKPLVSIVVPTRNSSNTIEQCLSAIEKQSYQNIEVIIVDSNSKDDTAKIAASKGCKVIFTGWKLLGARYLGCKAASGEFVLMLDSDQVLLEDTVERSLTLFKDYDMLCLGETSYTSNTFIDKMFEADRRLIHDDAQIQLNPIYGTLLARFYKRNLLDRAFGAIPKSLLPSVIAHDHAIIYYEAWKLSDRVSILPKAVYHNEPATVLDVWKKNFRYGRSTRAIMSNGYYNDLIRKKTHLRKTSTSKMTRDKLLSFLLLSLKAPAYLLGLYV